MSYLTDCQQAETSMDIPNSSLTDAMVSNPVTKSTSPGPLLGIGSPPPKPPRPMSPQQQAQATLQEAFPSIDVPIVRAVLVASGGQIEPAFTALLSRFSKGFFCGQVGKDLLITIV